MARAGSPLLERHTSYTDPPLPSLACFDFFKELFAFTNLSRNARRMVSSSCFNAFSYDSGRVGEADETPAPAPCAELRDRDRSRLAGSAVCGRVELGLGLGAVSVCEFFLASPDVPVMPFNLSCKAARSCVLDIIWPQEMRSSSAHGRKKQGRNRWPPPFPWVFV